MNPNAKPFVFNATASEWKPSWAPAPAAPAPAPAPVQAEPESVAPPPVPVEEKQEIIDNFTAGESEDVDENDPLWIAVLKLANGNRKEALKMLEDPDALMAYPEIAKIMESEGVDDIAGDGSESKSAPVEDWEKSDSADVATTEDATETLKESRPSKAVVVAPTEEEDIVMEPEVEVDGDPRDHMNLVFIGHVDAGKSTLSGSILYLMGKVDARTIERFEKEAKQRNRESWFLAFIMVETPCSTLIHPLGYL